MTIKLPLPQEKKLTMIFRVETGCLGPEGAKHIDNFCAKVQKEFIVIDADFIHWEIIPRHDKSLPEMQYQINNKTLSKDQAKKYLSLFGKTLHEFEEHLNQKIGLAIDQYLGY
jgi:hypothetical protein